MGIMRRHKILLGSKFVIPAIILGLLVFPSIVNYMLHPSAVSVTKNVTYFVATTANETFNTTIEAYPNVYTEIKIPQKKAEKIEITAISFKVPKRMPLKVVVAKLKFAPVPEPIEIYDIYEYIDIELINLKTNETVHPAGIIQFELPKAWIIQHNYDPEKAVMLEYRGKWIKLRTRMIGEDNESYYYVAQTESFSIFAIAVERVIPENCSKCHQNVAVELSMSPYHNFNCTFCHPGMSRNVTCVQCHPNIGEFSAHKKFIEWAENNTLMKGSNEACIACHTTAKIPIPKITERRYLSFEFDMGKLYDH